MKTKLFILILLIGLLTAACGTQPTDAPASTPTKKPATPTQTFTNTPAPTDTAIPTNTTVPTDTAFPATQGASQAATVSFASDIQPLLKSRCGSCHGGNKTEEGLNLLSYQAIIKGSDNGPVVNAGAADNSLLVEMVVSQEMPKRGPKLTPPQVQLIIDWVNQGALDN